MTKAKLIQQILANIPKMQQPGACQYLHGGKPCAVGSLLPMSTLKQLKKTGQNGNPVGRIARTKWWPSHLKGHEALIAYVQVQFDGAKTKRMFRDKMTELLAELLRLGNSQDKM